jgi:uncharacterized protein (DUF1778 family)
MEDSTMALINARVSASEEALIRSYAEVKKLSVSSLIRTAVMRVIEEEIDIDLAQQAWAEHVENDQSLDWEETKRTMGFHP